MYDWEEEVKEDWTTFISVLLETTSIHHYFEFACEEECEWGYLINRDEFSG